MDGLVFEYVPSVLLGLMNLVDGWEDQLKGGVAIQS